MAVKFTSTADTGSNKPQKFSVNLSAQAYKYDRPTGFMVFVLRPKIDRLSVTYDVSSSSAREEIRNRLEFLANDQSLRRLHSLGISGRGRGGARRRATTTDGEGDRGVRRQIHRSRPEEDLHHDR